MRNFPLQTIFYINAPLQSFFFQKHLPTSISVYFFLYFIYLFSFTGIIQENTD